MFFRRRKTKVEGLIAYYKLTDWWLSSFTEDERKLIDQRYQPMGSPSHTLTQGKIASSAPVTQFLNGLATWFRSREYASISDRIHNKIRETGQENPIIGPGYFQGRHYTTYVNEVEQLKRQEKFVEIEILLNNLIEANEAQARSERSGVAPWYYEQLAIIYRKQKAYAKEISILERFFAQEKLSGTKSSKLLERLEKAKILLNSQNK